MSLEGFDPVIDAQCRALVLGSFPGAASLRAGHYYAYPQNQFWPIVAATLGSDLLSLPFPARYRLLLASGLGLWDVITRCDRTGSLDQHIRDSQAADLPALLDRQPAVSYLLLNGKRAQRDARRLLATRSRSGLQLVDLPSTSPAHARLSLADKLALWRPALQQAMRPLS